MWSLQLDSRGKLSIVFTVWSVDPLQMCRSENGDHNVLKKFCLQDMSRNCWKGSGAGSYVMKRKQYWDLHILVTGWVQVKDVRMLWLLEQDKGGISLAKAEMRCLHELCKASNSVWKWSMLSESEMGILRRTKNPRWEQCVEYSL